MSAKLRRFFEVRVPLFTCAFLFVAIFVLYLFRGIELPPLYLKAQQCGIVVLFLGFSIRVLASFTTKYLGKLKIAGIYAVCRQPLLLGQFVSLVGLNVIVCNYYFLVLSTIIFVCNDCLATVKYDKILSYHYKDIWKIYSKQTNFVLPSFKRVSGITKQTLSISEADSSSNLPIFVAIYIILVEIATLSYM